VKHIVAKEDAKFVCLQETKTTSISDYRCYSLWGDNNVGWLHNEGDNGAGSMLSMWHKGKFIYHSHIMGNGFIAIVGQHVKSNFMCFVVNVYATCNYRDKVALWEALTSFKRSFQNMVGCFCGDFNAVRKEDERKGVRGSHSQRKEISGFNSFIDTNCLIDIPCVGKKYTWFKSNGTAKSRLDRFLISEEWLQKWPFYKQYVQPRSVSDHCAIVAKSWIKDWGPKPFRCLDMLGSWSQGSRSS